MFTGLAVPFLSSFTSEQQPQLKWDSLRIAFCYLIMLLMASALLVKMLLQLGGNTDSAVVTVALFVLLSALTLITWAPDGVDQEVLDLQETTQESLLEVSVQDRVRFRVEARRYLL